MGALVETIISVAAGALITWIMGWGRTFLSRRMKNPTVDAIRKNRKGIVSLGIVQDAILDAMEQHGEAIKKLAEANKTKPVAKEAESLARLAESQLDGAIKAQARSGLTDDDAEEISG